MLHGFGPQNSSMGGAGAALPMDPVGEMMFNPALLSVEDGQSITFSSEFFKDDPQFVVRMNDGRTGQAHPSTQIGILPSFGWTWKKPGSNMAVGFGLVAMAGFRTDNPEDPGSILFAAPPNGFGRIYTDYRVTRVPLEVAYQVTPEFSLGLAASAYIGELAIAPLPYKVYDSPGGNDNVRYYAQGGNLVSSMAYSFQLGFLYKLGDTMRVGGSYTTKQNFDPYTWNTTIADPNDPNYGKSRQLQYDLDGPMNGTLGVGWTPNDKVKVAADVMYIQYHGVAGFGSPGGIVNRTVYPFGWRNVWVYKAGIEYKAMDGVRLRLGYNYSYIPIRHEVILTGTGAPSLFKHHICVGVSVNASDNLTADLGAYYSPKQSVTGPYPDLDGNQVGIMTTSNSLKSVQLGLNWKF